MSPGENRRGSSWSSCQTALCCSLRTSWVTSRRSTNSLQYLCWGVISAGRGGCSWSWSGNRSAWPNIRLAVSPVTDLGGGAPEGPHYLEEQQIPLSRNSVLRESHRLRFPLSYRLTVGGMALFGFYPPSTECTTLHPADFQTGLPGQCKAVRAHPDSKISVIREWLWLRGLWRLEWGWHLAIMWSGLWLPESTYSRLGYGSHQINCHLLPRPSRIHSESSAHCSQSWFAGRSYICVEAHPIPVQLEPADSLAHLKVGHLVGLSYGGLPTLLWTYGDLSGFLVHCHLDLQYPLVCHPHGGLPLVQLF